MPAPPNPLQQMLTAGKKPGRRMPTRATNQGVHYPAPIGGINARDPARAMDPKDCLYLYNLIPFQYGLRVRSGWHEWATNLTPNVSNQYGVYDDGSPLKFSISAPLGGAQIGEWTSNDPTGVRSVLPFTGSKENGSGDRFFACTKTGIWDCTLSSSSPTQVLTFPTQDAFSGIGTGYAFANAGGTHYLCYTDATNGWYVYSEQTADWIKAVSTMDCTQWTPNTPVTAGNYYYTGTITGFTVRYTTPNGTSIPVDTSVAYLCTQSGTTGTTGPAGQTGTGITDGTAVFRWVPSVAPWAVAVDSNNNPILNRVDPNNFRFVMGWKNRLFFVQGNSQTAYYLPLQAIGGVASPLYFGSRFRYGGNLVGLWDWTVDGGTGIQSYLVAISKAGDVVVYQGTDPSSTSTFSIMGTWWVGDMPPGRNICTDFGGDLFILSRVGCLPLSKLVAGYMIRDPNIYATEKINNLFNIFMTQRGGIYGWSIKIHPADNLLVINIPPTPSQPRTQLVMSLASKGWAQFLNVPMTCMDQWHGRFWFGTEDGRVCVNEGYVDNQNLSGTLASPIDFSLLTSYQDGGVPNKKRLHMVRPLFSTDGNAPSYSAQVRFDFDLSDIGAVPTGTIPTVVTFDNAQWDVGMWDQNPDTAGQFTGTAGMGTAAAIVFRGTADGNATLLGFDAIMDSGGLL